MKKKAYSDPYMELVLLNGEDIICASETAADNDAPAPFSDDGAGSAERGKMCVGTPGYL